MLKEKLGDSWHDDTQLNERAEEIFRRLLRDSTGSHKGTSSAAGIDSHGLKKAMFAAGVKLSDKEAVRMIKESDENEDGLLQLNEFQAVIRNEVETYRRRESEVSTSRRRSGHAAVRLARPRLPRGGRHRRGRLREPGALLLPRPRRVTGIHAAGAVK